MKFFWVTLKMAKFTNTCDFVETDACGSKKRYTGRCGKPSGKVIYSKKNKSYVRKAKNRCKAKPYVQKGGGKYLGKGVRW